MKSFLRQTRNLPELAVGTRVTIRVIDAEAKTDAWRGVGNKKKKTCHDINPKSDSLILMDPP